MNTRDPLHDFAGRPCFALGHTAYSTHEAGIYRVALDWVEDEPAMVIWTDRGDGAFAICLSSAGKYADPSGRPNPEGMRESLRSLPMLGRDQTETELRALTDVILRYMPDLLRMPPQPRAVALESAGRPLVEVTERTQDGQMLREVVL